MQLLGTELKFDFVKEVREHTLAQRVHKAITGELPKEPKQPIEERVLVRSAKEKLAIRWDSQSFGVVTQEMLSIDSFVKTVTTLLDKINEVSPINQVKDRMIITEWLLPTPKCDFSALERKYRKAMISPQAIQDGAFDSSVILDSKIKDWILHHQSGAMEPKQLHDDYLIFKLDNVPKVFIFLLVSITETKVVKYSSEEIRNFLPKAFDLCKSHSDAFEKIWEAAL